MKIANLHHYVPATTASLSLRKMRFHSFQRLDAAILLLASLQLATAQVYPNLVERSLDSRSNITDGDRIAVAAVDSCSAFTKTSTSTGYATSGASNMTSTKLSTSLITKTISTSTLYSGIITSTMVATSTVTDSQTVTGTSTETSYVGATT